MSEKPRGLREIAFHSMSLANDTKTKSMQRDEKCLIKIDIELLIVTLLFFWQIQFNLGNTLASPCKDNCPQQNFP